jgi:hypothetical protein
MGVINFTPAKKYLTLTKLICIFIYRELQPKGVIFVSEHILWHTKNENALMGRPKGSSRNTI